MPKTKWTISSTSGGNDSADLVGCQIKQTDTGYDFRTSNKTVLSSTTDTTLPFTFPSFDYDGWKWDITVTSLGSRASGGWSNNNPGITGEEGTWSAGAGDDTTAKKSRKQPKARARTAGKS
ncbi:MAG TPA: hypothetical protein VIB00_07105 [Pyrinomonadaceae bacterium]|jgi:hypothetical protein